MGILGPLRRQTPEFPRHIFQHPHLVFTSRLCDCLIRSGALRKAGRTVAYLPSQRKNYVEGAFQGPWAPSGAQGSLAFRARRPVFRKEGQQPRSVLQPWDRGLAPLRLPQLCAGPDSTGGRQLLCPSTVRLPLCLRRGVPAVGPAGLVSAACLRIPCLPGTLSPSRLGKEEPCYGEGSEVLTGGPRPWVPIPR